jgi:fatty-acyl-CoA synthase
VRLAFSTLACPGWSLERVAEACREYGYDGVELRLIDGATIETDLAAGERRRVPAVLAGLPIVAVDTSIRLAGADPGRTGAELRWFLELAAEWESPLIRVFGGEGEPAAMAGLLSEAVPEAERLGVGIAVETHDALSSAEAVAAVLSRVDSPAVGALWDLLHTHRMGETPEAVMGWLGGRLLHVHVKDGRRRAGAEDWDLVLLGEGEVPVARSLRTLSAHGYDGWVAVEWEKKWHPEIAEPEVALPQHLAALAPEGA